MLATCITIMTSNVRNEETDDALMTLLKKRQWSGNDKEDIYRALNTLTGEEIQGFYDQHRRPKAYNVDVGRAPWLAPQERVSNMSFLDDFHNERDQPITKRKSLQLFGGNAANMVRGREVTRSRRLAPDGRALWTSSLTRTRPHLSDALTIIPQPRFT